MSSPRDSPPPGKPPGSKPPSSDEIVDDGWKSAAQTQRLLHELRVHQIELEMQNEELRVSRAEVELGLKRYTDLYDFAPVGYLTLSQQSTIRELNLPAASLLGRARARLVSAQLRSFVSPAARPVFDAWLRQVFSRQEARGCELVLLRDVLPPVSVQLEAQLSLDGDSIRVIVTDITDRKSMTEALRQAQKMEVIGQLAGGVAHDFNNILAAMVLNLGLLRTAGDLSGAGRDALLDLEALATRASSLTSQLLVFGRRQAMQQVRLDLNELVGGLFQMLERLLGEEIHCVLRTAKLDLCVAVDAAMIEQAVMNLCLNARDAMPSGGTLTLETSAVRFNAPGAGDNPQSRAGDFARLRVSDSGCGMSPEVLEHAFEPFFTTKELGKGSGLGLASVYGAVLQHRGWITVESREAEGTTFSVYLPHLDDRVPAPTVTLPAPPTAPIAATVLLVEDEQALREVGQRVLTGFGYTVLTAADGPAALALWKNHASKIDLLLTDMRMPGGINGLSLAKTLLETKPSLKVIVMSGYGVDLNALGNEPRFGFLPKPFGFDALAETVRRTLAATLHG